MRASIPTLSFGAASVALIVVACGSETTGGPTGDGAGSGDGDASSADAANDVLIISDASSDADPPADGPFNCGTTTCGATQYCVNPCCGGAKPQCYANPDGGACPVGFHAGACMGGEQGCEQDPCKPPPAYCIDDPNKAPAGCMKQGHGFACLCA